MSEAFAQEKKEGSLLETSTHAFVLAGCALEMIVQGFKKHRHVLNPANPEVAALLPHVHIDVVVFLAAKRIANDQQMTAHLTRYGFELSERLSKTMAELPVEQILCVEKCAPLQDLQYFFQKRCQALGYIRIIGKLRVSRVIDELRFTKVYSMNFIQNCSQIRNLRIECTLHFSDFRSHTKSKSFAVLSFGYVIGLPHGNDRQESSTYSEKARNQSLKFRDDSLRTALVLWHAGAQPRPRPREVDYDGKKYQSEDKQTKPNQTKQSSLHDVLGSYLGLFASS